MYNKLLIRSLNNSVVVISLCFMATTDLNLANIKSRHSLEFRSHILVGVSPKQIPLCPKRDKHVHKIALKQTQIKTAPYTVIVIVKSKMIGIQTSEFLMYPN
uniref:Uncharacterized protein n=1 Tax=Cacopsylla melanoneura TaxID=428564 RepID=A0A8D9EE54_9HEMI